MSRRKGSRATPPNAPAARALQTEAGMPDEPILNRVLLFVLLSLIPFRAICGETRTFEMMRWLRLEDAPGSPTPATTLTIFVIIFACGVVLLVDRLRRGEFALQFGTIVVGLLLLIIAGAISTIHAGQKHLALVGTLDFLGLILYMLVLRQLLRRPWHIRLAMTVVLATGCVVIAKCANQHFYENPETLAFYQEHKAEITSGGTSEVAAGLLHDYEQRMKAGSVSGYFMHPNVLASYLILIVAASLAVALHPSRRARVWPVVPPVLLAIVAFAAMYFTQSKGAMAACVLALVLWGIGRLLAGPAPDEKRRRRLAIGLAACVVLGAIGVGAVLKSDPSALGRSMLFRTMYWEGAANIAKANSTWRGIGAENFGRWFPQYKDITCPEDVDDPHCWPLKLLVEWGVFGLVGVLLIVAGVSRRLTRDSMRAGSASPTRPGSIVMWSAAVGCFALVWWLVIMGAASIAYLAFVLMLSGTAWFVGFLVLAYAGRARLDTGDGAFPGVFGDSCHGLLVGGLIAGAIGFALHTCIDLAMFNGGAATTFFALLAIAVAACGMQRPSGETREQSHPSAQSHPGIAMIVGVCGLATILLLAMLVVRPAAQVGRHLDIARSGKPPTDWSGFLRSPAYSAYTAAIAIDPFDGTAAGELSEELLRRAATLEQTEQVESVIDALAEADLHNGTVHRLRATLAYRRFMLTNDSEHLAIAIEQMRAAIAANPSAIQNRQSFAELLSRYAAAAGDENLRREAVDAWQAVLDVDAQRIYVSQPHHLTDEQKAGIQQRIAALQKSQTQPHTTRPAD